MTNEEKIMYAKVFNVSSNWIGRRAKRVQSIDEVNVGDLCAYKYKEEIQQVRNYTQQVTKYLLGVCTSKNGKKIFSKIYYRKDSNDLLSWYVSSSFELRCEYEYDLHIVYISSEEIEKLINKHKKEEEKKFKEEQKRRSEKLKITVGMYEDLVDSIARLRSGIACLKDDYYN